MIKYHKNFVAMFKKNDFCHDQGFLMKSELDELNQLDFKKNN